MIKSKRMTKFGLAKIEAAKKNGQWDKPDRPSISFEMPEEFERAVLKNSKARLFFEQLSPRYQKQYIAWIAVAKRPETRDKRIEEVIAPVGERGKIGFEIIV